MSVDGQNLDVLISEVKGENGPKGKKRAKPIRMFNNATTGAKGVITLLWGNDFDFGKVARILGNGVTAARVKTAFHNCVKNRLELHKAGKKGGMDILKTLQTQAAKFDEKRGNTAQTDKLTAMVASLGSVAGEGRKAVTENDILASLSLDFDE